jgi:hypothetical protein
MPTKDGLTKEARKLQWKPYKNKFEYMTANHIRSRKLPFSYETEKLEYTLTKKYIPDFILETKSKHKIYIETKGNGRSWDSAVRAKMVAVKSEHPDLDIRILFWANGEFGAKRKDGTRNTQLAWAEKNGFIAAVREIPNEWLL